MNQVILVHILDLNIAAQTITLPNQHILWIIPILRASSCCVFAARDQSEPARAHLIIQFIIISIPTKYEHTDTAADITNANLCAKHPKTKI